MKTHLVLRASAFLILNLTSIAVSCQEILNDNTLFPFASGFDSPVCIANAGDSRLFVVNQAGFINIVDSTGKINPEEFLNIQNKVKYGGEQGLLGLAFHPQFKSNGYFYVNYVGRGDSTHISRFTLSSGSSDKADSTSEFNLLKIYQPFTNHNGGDLCFGPDGYLYIGLGDGGSGGDPGNRAQNPMQHLGKMLRIDVDNGNPYSIPVSNPYYNKPSGLGEIWALGLRNPWRFSFDRKTGDLWIADVGQNKEEEINFQLSESRGGENYGWRCFEGSQEYNAGNCAPADSLTFPVYTFPHGADCSVTGGYVYRGDVSSPYYGYYFFTDYCSDWIRTLHKEGENWVMEDFGRFTGNNFSAFGEDYRGNLYITGLQSGKLFKVLEQTTQTGKHEVLHDIKIKQDPFSSKIRIETNYISLKLMHLTLYDAKGSVLFNQTSERNIFDIDPGNLVAGIYFLKIMIDGRSNVHKIFIQR